MGFSVDRIEVLGLHGRFDVELDLLPDVNVLYGRNGSGKTTLIHIIANILNRSLERFAYLDFVKVTLVLGRGPIITVEKRQYGGSPSAYNILVKVDDIVLSEFDANLVWNLDTAESSSYPSSGGYRWTPPTPASPDAYSQSLEIKDAARNLPVHNAAYFPAFRTMIEAWRSVESSSSPVPPPSVYPIDPYESTVTKFARDLFGQFVPNIDFPSAIEIERLLSDQIKSVEFDIATASEEILSNAFVSAFAALSERHSRPELELETSTRATSDILEGIELVLREINESQVEGNPDTRQADVFQKLLDLLPDVQSDEQSETIARVLSVYLDSLEKQLRLRWEKLEPIKSYVDSVNDFLEGKRLTFMATGSDPYDRQARISFVDFSTDSLKVLSSGERQVISMLYAASSSPMERSSVVLIDEPELSLHIDWQRLLIKRMTELLDGRQLIVCTHSPEIGADFENNYQEVKPSRSRYSDTAIAY